MRNSNDEWRVVTSEEISDLVKKCDNDDLTIQQVLYYTKLLSEGNETPFRRKKIGNKIWAYKLLDQNKRDIIFSCLEAVVKGGIFSKEFSFYRWLYDSIDSYKRSADESYPYMGTVLATLDDEHTYMSFSYAELSMMLTVPEEEVRKILNNCIKCGIIMAKFEVTCVADRLYFPILLRCANEDELRKLLEKKKRNNEQE